MKEYTLVKGDVVGKLTIYSKTLYFHKRFMESENLTTKIHVKIYIPERDEKFYGLTFHDSSVENSFELRQRKYGGYELKLEQFCRDSGVSSQLNKQKSHIKTDIIKSEELDKYIFNINIPTPTLGEIIN